MKRRIGILVCMVLFAAFMSGAAWGAKWDEDHFLVMFESKIAYSSSLSGNSVSKTALQSEATGILSRSKASLTVVKTFPFLSKATGKGFAVVKSSDGSKITAASIASVPEILAADSNFPIRVTQLPDDPMYDSQEGWMAPIGFPDAWDTATGDQSVIVAIFDTGMQLNHPDLIANLATDDNGNNGFNTFSPEADPIDGDGHGTHVAGIIGAVGNNAEGVSGVNWNVGLLPIKVLDDEGDGSSLNIIEGIEYALDQISKGINIKVANFSLSGWSETGGSGYETALRSLAERGVVLVFAAGNEYQDISNPGGQGSNPDDEEADYTGKKPYPASFSFEESLTVAAANATLDELAPFSNRSREYVHLAAPGTAILSTGHEGNYVLKSGTSMATPFVSGTAALLAGHFPNVTAKAIRSAILKNVKVVDEMKDLVSSDGLLDVSTILLTEPEEEEDVVDSISVSPASLTLVKGATDIVRVSILPKNSRATILALSSNPAVAVVSGNELLPKTYNISAVGPGEATINIKAGDKTASVKVFVRSGTIVVVPEAITLLPGDTYQLKVSGVESHRVAWTSSDPNVATVNDTGLVTAVGAGAGTIWATPDTGEGEVGSCTVTVEAKEPVGENSGCSIGGGVSPLTISLLGLPLLSLFIR